MLHHKEEFKTFLTKIEDEVAKKGLENDSSWLALKTKLQTCFWKKIQVERFKRGVGDKIS